MSNPPSTSALSQMAPATPGVVHAASYMEPAKAATEKQNPSSTPTVTVSDALSPKASFPVSVSATSTTSADASPGSAKASAPASSDISADTSSAASAEASAPAASDISADTSPGASAGGSASASSEVLADASAATFSTVTSMQAAIDDASIQYLTSGSRSQVLLPFHSTSQENVTSAATDSLATKDVRMQRVVESAMSNAATRQIEAVKAAEEASSCAVEETEQQPEARNLSTNPSYQDATETSDTDTDADTDTDTEINAYEKPCKKLCIFISNVLNELWKDVNVNDESYNRLLFKQVTKEDIGKSCGASPRERLLNPFNLSIINYYHNHHLYDSSRLKVHVGISHH